MRKRILSTLLVCCMLLAMLPTALAAGGAVAFDTVEAEAGKSVEMQVSLSDNPGVISMILSVSYPEELTLTGVTDGGLLNGSLLNTDEYANPYLLSWADLTASEDNTADGLLATLTFAVKDGVTPGAELAVTAEVDTENTFNVDFDEQDFTITSGVVKVKGTPTPVDKFAIAVVTVEGGKITASAEEAAENDTITLTAEADENYTFKSWDVKDADDNALTVSNDTFTMPASNVTVSAVFEEDETPSDDKYAITVSTVEGGTISADADEAEEGATITLTATADDGYAFKSWDVTDADGNEITVSSDTFTMPGSAVTVSAVFEKSGGTTPTPTPGGQGCYVATSVYGSYDCPEVWTLRRFRDNVLAETWYGRLFIRAYYAVSPTIVKLFGGNEWFQNFFKGRLDQMVANLQADGFESTPYDDIDW